MKIGKEEFAFKFVETFGEEDLLADHLHAYDQLLGHVFFLKS